MWRTSARNPLAPRIFTAALLLTCAACTTTPSTTPDHRAPTAAAPIPDVHGSGPGPSTGPTALHGSWDVSQLANPCRALTQQEAVQILGRPVNAPIKVDSWPPVCAFGLTPAAPFGVGPTVQASVSEYLYLLDDSADSGLIDFDRGRSNPAVIEVVTGIGDMAYWTADKTELQVMQGKTHVITKFGGSNPPPNARDKAVAITRLSLPRSIPS